MTRLEWTEPAAADLENIQATLPEIPLNMPMLLSNG